MFLHDERPPSPETNKTDASSADFAIGGLSPTPARNHAQVLVGEQTRLAPPDASYDDFAAQEDDDDGPLISYRLEVDSEEFSTSVSSTSPTTEYFNSPSVSRTDHTISEVDYYSHEKVSVESVYCDPDGKYDNSLADYPLNTHPDTDQIITVPYSGTYRHDEDKVLDTHDTTAGYLESIDTQFGSLPKLSYDPPVSDPPVSDIDPPVFDIDPPVSDIDPPVFDIDPPVSDIEPPVFEFKKPVFHIKIPVSDIEPPVSDIEPPVSDIEPPVSYTLDEPEKKSASDNYPSTIVEPSPRQTKSSLQELLTASQINQCYFEARLRQVAFSTFNNEPACLVLFEVNFQPKKARKRFRFREATIEVIFQDGQDGTKSAPEFEAAQKQIVSSRQPHGGHEMSEQQKSVSVLSLFPRKKQSPPLFSSSAQNLSLQMEPHEPAISVEITEFSPKLAYGHASRGEQKFEVSANLGSLLNGVATVSGMGALFQPALTPLPQMPMHSSSSAPGNRETPKDLSSFSASKPILAASPNLLPLNVSYARSSSLDSQEIVHGCLRGQPPQSVVWTITENELDRKGIQPMYKLAVIVVHEKQRCFTATVRMRAIIPLTSLGGSMPVRGGNEEPILFKPEATVSGQSLSRETSEKTMRGLQGGVIQVNGKVFRPLDSTNAGAKVLGKLSGGVEDLSELDLDELTAIKVC